MIVTEKLDFRGKGPSKEISRRVSYWRRSTLKERFEFKASAAGCRREQVNPAYTSQTCPECGYLVRHEVVLITVKSGTDRDFTRCSTSGFLPAHASPVMAGCEAAETM